MSHQHRPQLVPHNYHKRPPVPDVAPRAMDHTLIITKRRMEPDSDTNSDPVSPATKTSKYNEAAPIREAPERFLPRHITRTEASVAVAFTLAFAHREEYVKPVFRDNPKIDVKLR